MTGATLRGSGPIYRRGDDRAHLLAAEDEYALCGRPGPWTTTPPRPARRPANAAEDQAEGRQGPAKPKRCPDCELAARHAGTRQPAPGPEPGELPWSDQLAPSWAATLATFSRAGLELAPLTVTPAPPLPLAS